MWRWLALALVAIAVVVFGFSLIDSSGGGAVSASAEFAGVSGDTSGYSRAIDAYDWNFPADFGAHPDFQTEWWYYTGNLADENGRRFGFQFTIFRRALSPDAAETRIRMAHRTGLSGAFHRYRYRRWAVPPCRAIQPGRSRIGRGDG